jgi:hypothetical protein
LLLLVLLSVLLLLLNNATVDNGVDVSVVGCRCREEEADSADLWYDGDDIVRYGSLHSSRAGGGTGDIRNRPMHPNSSYGLPGGLNDRLG